MQENLRPYIRQNLQDPISGSVTQGHQGKWTDETYVSFGEECRSMCLLCIVLSPALMSGALSLEHLSV